MAYCLDRNILIVNIRPIFISISFLLTEIELEALTISLIFYTFYGTGNKVLEVKIIGLLSPAL